MNGRKAYRLMPIMLLALFGAPSVQAEQCWSSGSNALNVKVANVAPSWQVLTVGFIPAKIQRNTNKAQNLHQYVPGFFFQRDNCPSPANNNTQATPFGLTSLQPLNCYRFGVATNAYPSFGAALLVAQWPSPAAKSAAGTLAGCEFKCGSKTCRVQASDGLPVELMSFSVDDEETGE